MSREIVIVLLYTKVSKPKRSTDRGGKVLFRSLRHKLDPLDREILEKAFDATWDAVRGNDLPVDFDSDEGLEAILRRELIEIACFNGVSDPETLRDILFISSARRSTKHSMRRSKWREKGEINPRSSFG